MAKKTIRKTVTRGPVRVSSRWTSVAPTSILMTSSQERAVGENRALASRYRALERTVQVTVCTRTLSGQRIQEARGSLEQSNVDDYRPNEADRDRAESRLKDLGLEIVRRGRFATTVRGPASLVSNVIGQPLKLFSSPRLNTMRGARLLAAREEEISPFDLYTAPESSFTCPGRVSEAIDHFVFIPPPLYFAPPAGSPPALGYHTLSPADIRSHLRVPASATGQGIRVAIIDTGFFPHPYYAANRLNLTAVSMPGGQPADVDDYGHGTAIALNVLAVAPKAHVIGIKQTDPPQDAVEFAAEQGARIISCSWGWNYEQSFPVLEATLRSIIKDDNIIPLFAAGNGHYSWPGSMPEVLSIGGVHADAAGQLEASNYASGFMSSHYPGRRVPDVSGLVGQSPKGIYIPMPCQPGCEMDKSFGGGTFPDGDETNGTDGWVVASGTSSATPQIAGVVALMLEKAASKSPAPALDVAAICQILETTAQPVQTGKNAFGFPAQGQPNVATGYGLVDATAALGQV